MTTRKEFLVASAALAVGGASGGRALPGGSQKLKESDRTENGDCARELVRFCRNHISPGRLKGFLMASWTDCKGEDAFKFNCAGIDQLAAAMVGG